MPNTVSASEIHLEPQSTAAIGDDCNLKVLCQADNVLGEILAAQAFQKTDLCVRHKDLCDLILSSEIHHRLGDVATAKNACFDLETSRKAKMLLYCLPFLGW